MSRQSHAVHYGSTNIELASQQCSGSLFADVLVPEILKFLLYYRGQIPVLYDDLTEHIRAQPSLTAASVRRPQRSRRARAATRLVDEVTALLSTITKDLFSETHRTSMLVMFGTNTTAPREIWEFTFPSVCPVDTIATAQRIPEDKSAIAICRQAMRDITIQSFDMPEGTAEKKRCRMFVLFQIPVPTVYSGSSFALQQGLRVRMRKGTCNTFSILMEGKHDEIYENVECTGKRLERVDANDGLWLLSKHVVHGFA
jgi:hypothetical protein